MNYYIDINFKDRSQEIENVFQPTLEDIKNDPEFYAELVNDLIYHCHLILSNPHINNHTLL